MLGGFDPVCPAAAKESEQAPWNQEWSCHIGFFAFNWSCFINYRSPKSVFHSPPPTPQLPLGLNLEFYIKHEIHENIKTSTTQFCLTSSRDGKSGESLEVQPQLANIGRNFLNRVSTCSSSGC